MIDYGYILASEIVAQIRPIEFQGVGLLPRFTQPAIQTLQLELWRDLMRPGPLWSNIRVVQNGDDVHPRHFMSARVGDGLIVHSQINAAALGDYLADGATLVYNHLQESSRIVQRIQESLEYQLNARVWIQAYLTTSDQSAFGLHVDDHNFVVVQVVGTKTWEVDFGAAAKSTDSPFAVTLSSGELLAAASNTPHKVSGCGGVSLHLTIAFDWLTDDHHGSVIPSTDIESHRRCARLGSAIPMILSDKIATNCLSFRFRDRVRPQTCTDEIATRITCNSGEFRVDARMADVIAELARGREMTRAEITTMTAGLSDVQVDRFLRFGVQNDFLSCSG